MFNQPIRPDIKIEQFEGKTVMHVFIAELPVSQKPVYFKSEGLPRGAYRRIGSSDQKCTDDDLFVFYNKEDSLDSSVIKETSLDDLSDEAIQLYRNLRKKVNPYAEELQYTDVELLQSLGCLRKVNEVWYLTYAGLLVFGKKQSHRRLLPMVRVDYIRVPGNEWITNPEERFTTTDMRGSLIEILQRTFNAIADDLPKGFLLPEGAIQANSIGLPTRVLREAIVNSLIHRTYRENQPIQIIRYGNRIELKNPGFSLKQGDLLGEPGSKNRNPLIAAIFHETNLAETKGSGIRTMRLLMEKAELLPPTFESDHGNNQFTARLLLHHFLDEADINWLMRFNVFDLTDSEKRALVFIREVGAIDNATHRQLNGLDAIHSSFDLKALRDKGIIIQKGKGRSTYYIPNFEFDIFQYKNEEQILTNNKCAPNLTTSSTPQYDSSSTLQSNNSSTLRSDNSSAPRFNSPSAPLTNSKIMLYNHDNNISIHINTNTYKTVLDGSSAPRSDNSSAPRSDDSSAPFSRQSFDSENINSVKSLPKTLRKRIKDLPFRTYNNKILEAIILDLCTWKPLKSKELSSILGKSEKYLLRNFITPMKQAGKLSHTHPEMHNHPAQAYRTVKSNDGEGAK